MSKKSKYKLASENKKKVLKDVERKERPPSKDWNRLVLGIKEDE